MPFVKPEKKREGIKFLIYGETGSGKTPFGLSFPNQALIDSDSGTNFYDDKNVKLTSSTLSFKELNSDLDDLELEEELLEEIETFNIDSVTRFHENLQHAAMKVVEQRARKNNRLLESEGLSFKEYGNIKLQYDKFFARMMTFAKQAKNLVFIAEQKDKTENRNGTPIKVGVMPNMQKESEYDFDVVVRTYNKDGKPFGLIVKDRTGTYTVGEEIEKPSYDNWKDAITKAQKGKKRDKAEIQDYDEVIDNEAEEFDETGDLIKDKISDRIKKLSREQKDKFIEEMDGQLGDHKFKNFTDKDKLQQTLDIVKSIK